MLPMNQLPLNQMPMLSQDDYNDYLEFQNFKKLKQQYNKSAAVGIPQSLNLSAANSSAAAAAAFNFFNSAAANGGSSLNSIFPMTTSAPSTTSMLNQTFFNQQQQNHQNHQQQQSTQIIPKVVPNGIPLAMMRQPTGASFMQPYKNMPNFPGLKGGASNYAQPSPAMYMPPALPTQSLTPKVATPHTPQQLITTPTTPIQLQQQQHLHQTVITPTPTMSPPKRRVPSPEIIVDDRPIFDIPEKKTKSEKTFAELYTTKNENFLPKLSLQNNTENGNSSSYHQMTSSSISTLPSIDNSLKTISTSSISLPSTIPSLPSMPSIPERIVLSPPNGTTKMTVPTPEKLSFPLPQQQPIPQPQPQQQHQSPTSDPSYMDDEETHIIITARPRVPDSAERDETYTTEDDSDYDTNLRPKETPLQYKERMMVRVMDKAKRKNEASKRSREKRKREHQDRQIEKQRLEKRNMELTEKLMNLKEALKRLRPQICVSCNEQVQKFLDQCQSSREGMNVFVLRPCKQDKCPGNKTVGRELGKFARGQ